MAFYRCVSRSAEFISTIFIALYEYWRIWQFSVGKWNIWDFWCPSCIKPCFLLFLAERVSIWIFFIKLTKQVYLFCFTITESFLLAQNFMGSCYKAIILNVDAMYMYIFIIYLLKYLNQLLDNSWFLSSIINTYIYINIKMWTFHKHLKIIFHLWHLSYDHCSRKVELHMVNMTVSYHRQCQKSQRQNVLKEKVDCIVFHCQPWRNYIP